MPGLANQDCGPTLNIGEILVEIMATKTGHGFREPLDLVGPFPSGAPAIFIDQCAKVSKSASIIGAVGNDDFGRLNIERLKQDGADVSGVLIDDVYPTGTAFVRYTDSGDRDFVFNIKKSAAAQVFWCEQVERTVMKAGHLHVMGTALLDQTLGTIIQKAAQIVRHKGGTISLDPNLRKELKADAPARQRFREILQNCDLLLPSDEELMITAGARSRDSALRTLFDKGIKEIILKQGSSGATAFICDGNSFHCPAFKVTQVDPTGAGDCFGGTYVACRRLGKPVEESLRFANAAGALNVTVRGPMEGTSTLDQLDAFISTQGSGHAG